MINKILGNKDYYAEGKINEGSYGEIFKITSVIGKKTYALKALELSKLEKLKKMHEAIIEIIVLKKLSHPGVIKIFEIIHRESYIGIVLELCPFGDLFNLMKAINKKIDLAKKKRKIMIYYLAQILETLDYLHSFKIVHRDLKPENIVLGSDLRAKIIDFGTAKIINTSIMTS